VGIFSFQTIVVIPIQTISFYNLPKRLSSKELIVVIPIQTTGFYNVVLLSPPTSRKRSAKHRKL
jgi:hypothetical protein